MAEEKIGVAIAGCGQIAIKRHAPEYAANPHAEIVGFYDYAPERAQELAARYGGKVYPSFEELLEDKNVAAVSVCTPNALHAKHAIAAMRAGKAVLCEKPMAASIEEAAGMICAQQETGSHLMLGLNQRFVPTHIRAKKLLQSGVIGKILSIQTNFKHGGPESWSVEKKGSWFFSKEKAAFGVLGDLGIHKLDLVRYLLGDEIHDIFAVLQTLDKRDENGSLIDLEDNATCLFRTKGNISGTVAVSWTNYGPEDNSTVIYGDRGTMKIFAQESDDICVDLRDGTSFHFKAGGISTNDNQMASGVIDAFVESLLTGSEPPVSVQDGYNTLACLEAARQSSELGEWTEVPLWGT